MISLFPDSLHFLSVSRDGHEVFSVSKTLFSEYHEHIFVMYLGHFYMGSYGDTLDKIISNKRLIILLQEGHFWSREAGLHSHYMILIVITETEGK
jgi:hypothetical protein